MLESIRKIIVPTDFSDQSEVALRTAAVLAQRNDASVHLLHAIRLPLFHTSHDVNVPQTIWEGLRKAARERMYESQYLLEEAGVSEVELIVSDAHQPAETIEASAREIDADLVVMATHGRRGIAHAFLGSVTERTIRSAPCPVLTVKNTGVHEMPPRRILVPTDFSTCSDRAIDLACSLARHSAADIDVLHVLDRLPDYLRYRSEEAVDFEKRIREASMDRLQRVESKLTGEGFSVETHLADGTPADVIARQADRLASDLIVMGTHGRTAFEHTMIGSVTEHAMRLAACPVLTTNQT